MSIIQIWSKYNFSYDCLFSNMTDAILDTKILFTEIVSASVYHYNSEIANLRHALAALQQLLERYPTSSILCCDLQQVKSSLKENRKHTQISFTIVMLLVGRKGKIGSIRNSLINLNGKPMHIHLNLCIGPHWILSHTVNVVLSTCFGSRHS